MSLDLYQKYLAAKGVNISASYLETALRKLITDGYVEKMRIGYGRKNVKIKSLASESGRKRKNICRLTRKGEAFARGALSEQSEARGAAGTGAAHGMERLTSISYDTMEDERYIRMLQTKIFGTVCKARLPGIRYVDCADFKKLFNNRIAVGSRVTGAFLTEDCFGDSAVTPIYCTGGYAALQNRVKERTMRRELERIYSAPAAESIVICDTWHTIAENIRIWAKRERGGGAGKVKRGKAHPLLIEPMEGMAGYCHTYSVRGAEMAAAYRIPKAQRSAYYAACLKEKERFREYFSSGGPYGLFDAQTDDACVYIGYEVEPERMKDLLLRMDAASENPCDKGLVIICREDERPLYEYLFSGTREMQFLSIQTTDNLPPAPPPGSVPKSGD